MPIPDKPAQPITVSWRVEGMKSQESKHYPHTVCLFKKGRLKTRHIFSPSNNLIGKCELAEHPVYVYDNEHRAGVAQSVEQRIRNAKVGGSIPFSGTRLDKERSSENLVLGFQTTFFIGEFFQG